MTSDYATPSTATGMDLKDHLGNLLLIKVNEAVTGIVTAYGPSDAIRADVVILDGADKGKTYDDTLIFPKVLQSQLRPRIGQRVLGRLGQGTAKPGQSAPWTLTAASAEDIQVAEKYDAYMATKSITTPANEPF